MARFPEDSIVITVWMNEWSDDFDPYDSIKSNRFSVWLKTITIAPPHGIKHLRHLYTYPVAIGLKNTSHEEVEKAFATDLELLSKGTKVSQFYCAKNQNCVNVHAEIL